MTGAWGEQIAAAFLEHKDYRVIARNSRTRFGEIDIVAMQGKYVVFAEVKTRKNARFAAARENVTAAKQARIIAAAEEWLQTHPTELQPRFDVIEVYGEENSLLPPHINHLENAFGG